MSDDEELEEPWGLLISTCNAVGGEEEERIPVVGSRFLIGRDKSAELVVEENKFVSSRHCLLERDSEGGKWVSDFSSNGTLLNGARFQKHTKVKLKDGDTIGVVFRRDRTDCNVVYRFQDLEPMESTEPLTEEEEEVGGGRGEEDETVDLTLDYSALVSETESREGGGGGTGGGDGDKKESREGGAGGEGGGGGGTGGGEGVKEEEGEGGAGGEGGGRGGGGGEIGEGGRDGDKKDGGCKRKLEEEEEEEKDTPEAKKPALNEHNKDNSNITIVEEKASSFSAAKGEDSEEKDQQAKVVKTDSIEQTLICQICQEMLHDCISLQPCMHSYCGGCYSEWMSTSDKCPGCRGKVQRINKNHLVNNLVEAFLRANPDRKRAEEDLKELDQKNKITKDMIYPSHSSGGADVYYNFSESETDGSDDDQRSSPPTFPGTSPFSFSTAVRPTGLFVPPGIPPFPGFGRGATTPGSFSCRQCPSYTGVRQSNPSYPSPPPFTCSPLSTNHVLCQCCLHPMPDRRTETDSSSIPPQKCDLCRQAFCHMYWGCSRPGCTGCLAVFREMEFSDSTLTSIIHHNSFESEILKDYLQSQGKTAKDMLSDSCDKLDDGTYHCSNGSIMSGSVVCNRCALGPFSELVYQYRSDIPTADLPESARNRPDCHWGRNCRTQRHNPSHARRYNHICEQTRTTN